MSCAYEFLKECDCFFVLTINGDYPAGRPFDAVMELGDNLCICTNDLNDAHMQLRENEHVQIVAKKPDSRQWIRITGLATERSDSFIKDKMLKECPVLQRRFSDVGYEHMLVFEVKVENVQLK